MNHPLHARRSRRLPYLLLATAGVTWSHHAVAQTTLDVIGPHEYELPVDFEAFNVFVQYATLDRNGNAYDDNGDEESGAKVETLVGLSKYVRFWSPAAHRHIGLAYEIIVPEVSVRATDGSGSYVGGLGDPLTGPAIWFKPSSSSTLGFQSFVQIPVGDTDVSDRNWKNLSSLFWDLRLGARWGLTGDIGAVIQGEKPDGSTPRTTYHTNHRLGLRLTPLLEPFVGLDAEHSSANGEFPAAEVVDGSFGVMLHTFANQSVTLRYSSSLAGENHPINDSFNLKYVYVW